MARSYTVNVNIDDPNNAVWFQEVGNSRGTIANFPDIIYGEASFDLTVYFWHGPLDNTGAPISGTTPANFLSGDGLTLYGRIEDQPSGVAPVALATGLFTTGDNSILFEVDAGLVPNEWSRVDEDTTAKYPIAIWFTGIHEADEITGKTNVIVIDKEHVGTGDALIIDASQLTYTPSTPSNWIVTPTTMADGLDELSERVQTLEDNPASGDMQAATYDPQSIQADAFDRANMTGTQLASTISDFDSAISSNAALTGTVTVHSDVNSAGSGNIITSSERTVIGQASAHFIANNPHNIDASTVGNTIAQWNANKIQGFDAPIPTGVADDQKVLTYDDTSGQYQLVSPPGLGGGESNDLSLQGSGEDIRISKSGSDILIKGVLGTGVISTTTNSNNIEINLPQSAEGVVGGVALANAGNVASLDNDVALSPFQADQMIGDKADKDLTINSVIADYTLLSGDKGSVVEVTNSITLPVLTQGYNCLIYNSSATTSAITLSGTTIDNTSNLNISANGSMSVIYLSETRIIIDGNTEA